MSAEIDNIEQLNRSEDKTLHTFMVPRLMT